MKVENARSTTAAQDPKTAIRLFRKLETLCEAFFIFYVKTKVCIADQLKCGFRRDCSFALILLDIFGVFCTRLYKGDLLLSFIKVTSVKERVLMIDFLCKTFMLKYDRCLVAAFTFAFTDIVLRM